MQYLNELLAFARTKPADEGYDYKDNLVCPFAQFLKAIGLAKEPSVGPATWGDLHHSSRSSDHQIPPEIGGALSAFSELAPVTGWENRRRAARRLWTWGALTARLEAICDDSVHTA